MSDQPGSYWARWQQKCCRAPSLRCENTWDRPGSARVRTRGCQRSCCTANRARHDRRPTDLRRFHPQPEACCNIPFVASTNPSARQGPPRTQASIALPTPRTWKSPGRPRSTTNAAAASPGRIPSPVCLSSNRGRSSKRSFLSRRLSTPTTRQVSAPALNALSTASIAEEIDARPRNNRLAGCLTPFDGVWSR